jgi:valyl-tRNA synthetase
MKEELPTRYEPAAIEQKWYARWEEGEFFTPIVDRERPKFSIVIPPPNVTGRLHIGHALVNTLQDIVVRWKRMSGFNTLWLPGTDHAGIATQLVVERELNKQGISRHDIGREQFVMKIWEWKESYGHQIIDQLKRLGASADWSRLRFTLDEGLSRAVRYVFVKLYEEGLIYRGVAMVNWCPHCQTAISDVEVEYGERQSKLYQIDYRVAGSDRRLTVATTRPETMLGDTALAVHPDDERYRDLIGSRAVVPIADWEVPIIGDAILVDPQFGTGVVKVTPSHDRSDYEAGLRNALPQLQVIDESGRMTAAAGAGYEGMDRFEARKNVVAALRDAGLLRDVRNYTHSVGIHGKCETIIEPMVSRQWFVKIEPLAKPAIDAVRSGAIRILPQTWEATYFNWMENIHDWTISRQLWWGHRIPAFYCANGHVTVAMEEPRGCPQCGSAEITQETDVLDTWFSSALWPFSTLGWPDETPDYQVFYPTDVLITGFDILFFWVARMIMFGIHFTGKEPFSQVYLNGLVRDEHGQKMAKVKGNVIDPIEVIDEYGADAVRFTLAILASGRDIPLARSRMQGYAAFANKIWNASRFALMHIDTDIKSARKLKIEDVKIVERWILSRLNETTVLVNKALSAYRFDEASNLIYQFFWHDFCDWYIEMAKPVLLGRHGDDTDRTNAKRVLLEVLDRSLRLLHPFMPFITEEIWQKLGGVEPSIMVADYPVENEELHDTDAERLVDLARQMVTRVRNLRAEKGFTPGERPALHLAASDERDANFFRHYDYLLVSLARLSGVHVNEPAPATAFKDAIGGIQIAVDFPAKERTPEEIERMRRDLEKARKELEGVDARLGNEQFARNAPPHIVQVAQARQAELRAKIEKLLENQ